HNWVRRYWHKGMAGPVDRSKRPKSFHRTLAHVELKVMELRRAHSRWGPARLTYGAREERGRPASLSFQHQPDPAPQWAHRGPGPAKWRKAAAPCDNPQSSCPAATTARRRGRARSASALPRADFLGDRT